MLVKDILLSLSIIILRLKLVNNGIYNVFVIEGDEYIGNAISKGHDWDAWMRRDLEKYYVSGTDILDIGANIGYNSLMFSDYGPVASFEPVYHEIVIKNARNNALKHSIVIHPCALSNEDTTTEIFIPGKGCQSNTHINYGGTSFHLKEGMKGDSVRVRCKRLDDIYDGKPSIIKIDVEEHELQVLEGAKETIKKHMPTILVEIHDFETSPVAKFLKSLGYDTPDPRPEGVFLYRAKDILSII